ncbi:restriction endonuclease subunit S [Salinispora arenicola]|uniref:restriction endonuclease subunit S n=1 Tax=Salinispora arenicola TaxID=168697 RepID=UPI0012BCE8B3|nr:restriction endonuclease subunit S [Salinispora arenicola]
MTRLADIAAINPRLEVRPSPDAPVSFVAMASVDADSGSTRRGESRRFSDTAKGYTQFKNGDILVAKITPCFENGKIARANLTHELGSGSTEFHVVRPDQNRADPRYVLHYLRQPNIRIDGTRRMTGSGGQRRVPEAFIAELDIPLPPLAEQQRIADALDQAAILRQASIAAREKLNRLRFSMFLDRFGDPAQNIRQWPSVRLGDLVFAIESGHSPVCHDRPAEGEEWGVLKLSSITSCEFDPSQNKALPAGREPHVRAQVRPGDLLFSRKNTRELVAACALVRETPPRLLMSDLIFRLQLKPNAMVNSAYLHALLTFPSKRRMVQELASGSAGSMPNISKSRLLELPIEVPAVAEQNAFVAAIEKLESLLDANAASMRRLDELLRSLQYRAFRGEL